MEPWLIKFFSCCGVIWFIIFVSLFAASFKYASELDLCIRYNTITNVVDDALWNDGKPGTYFMAQAFSFMCFPKQHKRMRLSNGVHPSIDGPTLLVRSKEGLKVTMDLDFEYILTPSKIVDLYNLLGRKFEDEINVAALSALHRTSAKFEALDFLSPRRYHIRSEMLKELNVTLTPLHITVKDLHLFHVSVASEFQKWIQDIENIKLEQKLKLEDRILQLANQNNLKAKEKIDLNAARREIIINAERDVSTASSARLGDLTFAKTKASIKDREVRRERSLDSIKYARRLSLAREKRLLLLRQLQNAQDKAKIDFETYLLNATNQATIVQLNAEAEATKIANFAKAENSVLSERFAAELQMYKALRNSANFNNTEILRYMWISTHKNLRNMNFFLDYKKVPLALEGMQV